METPVLVAEVRLCGARRTGAFPDLQMSLLPPGVDVND
jgi:hypothetical protein